MYVCICAGKKVDKICLSIVWRKALYWDFCAPLTHTHTSRNINCMPQLRFVEPNKKFYFWHSIQDERLFQFNVHCVTFSNGFNSRIQPWVSCLVSFFTFIQVLPKNRKQENEWNGNSNLTGKSIIVRRAHSNTLTVEPFYFLRPLRRAYP